MWWDPWQGVDSGRLLPLAFIPQNDNGDSKERNESYHVYVNRDYVGDKELIGQGEDGVSAIQDYLSSRGFHEFAMQMEGDRIYVHSEEEEQSEDMKRHLAVYLNIR